MPISAKSAYLPRLTIGGGAGYASTTFESLGNTNKPRYAIGPVLSWPLLNLGRVKAAVDVASAQEAEAEAYYRKARLQAHEEIESSVVAYNKARASLQHLEAAATASERAAELAGTHRLYNDAAAFARKAVALDSLAWRGYALLGINALRRGAMDSGRVHLERAFAGDPYDVWTKNTLDLLDTLETVNREQRLTRLRWTLGHVYDISPENIARAKALGMTLGVHGAAMQAGARMPLRRIADSGIVFGLGTDATIVSHYSPFVTLGWVVSGLDAGGNRVLDETLTREEALVAHTRSNAYLFFQEDALGSLEPGKYADLVVLDRDYMTVPAAEIKRIRPTLTMVGGVVVYRAAP